MLTSEELARVLGHDFDGDTSRREATEPIINETRRVRIVDDGGSPVADAKIEVWQSHHDADVPPDATQTSNSAGLAEITIERKTSEVLVSKERVGTSGIWKDKSAPRELKDEAIIELRPTGRIRGQVVWLDGVPESGAVLTFEEVSGGERGTRPRPLSPVTADVGGRFDVEVDTPFFSQIVVSARDRHAAPRLVVVNPGQTDDLTLKFPAYSISGSLIVGPGEVLHDPKIAAGNTTRPEIDGTVDEHGLFRIELTEPATYSVRAHAAGVVQDQQVTAQVDDQTPSAKVQVRLVPEAVVAGKVRWSNGGGPLGYAMVMAWPVDDRRVAEEPEFATFRAMTLTGMDGAFELRGLHPDLTYSLSVSQLPTHKVAVVREVTPGTRDLVVTAEGPPPKSVTLRGHVRDARSGAPVTRFEATARDWMSHGYMSIGRATAWHDDPQGRFEIAELESNASYAVLINADGYAPLSYGPVNLGLEPPLLELSLSRWGALHLRVIDASGDAIPGASVALWPGYPREESESAKALRTDVTDAAGGVTWSELAPGDYWLEGATATLRGGPTTVSVPGDGARDAQLVLSEAGEEGAVEVTLRDFDGSPAPQMEVRVVRLAGVLDAPPKEQPRWTCQTDSAGTFKQAVPAGAYTLVSSRSGLFAFSGRVFVPGGESVRVDMRLK
jgi:protocatechuate 3,4-dioxygenase beta subunit